MKKLIFGIAIILLTISLHPQSKLLLLIGGETQAEALANAYAQRVVADGGIVVNKSAVLSAITTAIANNTWDSVKVWVAYNYGVKKNANNKITKLYSLKGNDLIQSDTSKSPTWYADSIYFDGTNDHLYAQFSMANPYTMFAVFKPTLLLGNARGLIDGDTSGRINWSINTDGKMVIQPAPYTKVIQGLAGDCLINTKYLGMVVNNLTSSRMRKNGSNLGGTELLATSSGTTGGVTVGLNGNKSSFPFRGSINEIKVLNIALSPDAYGLDETFFNTKYTIY